MSQEKPFPEERIQTITEFDAVHPRFVKESQEAILEYEQKHNYYCRQCNLYFAPTYEGLRIHFDKEIITHRPCGSCFYCKAKVYEYSINGELQVYHSCRKKKFMEVD